MWRTRHAKRGDGAREAEIRRCRSTLAVSGTAVIVSAIWGLVRTFMLNVLSEPNTEIATEVDVSWVPRFAAAIASDPRTMVALLVAILVALPLELCIRIYVGRSALAESRGERRSLLYVALAMLIAAFTMTGMIVTFVLLPVRVGLVSLLTTVTVDVTMLVMMTDLIWAALRLRRLDASGYERGW